jgi:putative ABC transport system permease protein
MIMIANLAKITYRTVLRQKWYSTINIIGLALGLTCTLLIALHIYDDISYDKHHTKADRIYRFTQWEPTRELPAYTAPAWLDILTSDIPQIEAGTRIYEPFGELQLLLKVGQKQVYDKTVKFADANVFQVFDFPLVQGNMHTALAEPYSVVISESAAKRYFGTENSMGKVIRVENKFDLKVTGVMRDIPHTSHLKFELLGSMETVKREFALPDGFKSLFWNPFLTYILLKEGASAQAIEPLFQQIKNKVAKDIPVVLALHPLTSIHLVDENAQATVGFLAIVGAIILLLACVNYTNLATARYSSRAREVGVRKTLGAGRFQLAMQFWGESFLLTCIALGFSLLAVELLLPTFNTLTGKHLQLLGGNLALLGSIIVATLLAVSLFAGVYPAIMLSGFKPVDALKSSAANTRLQTGSGRFSLRSVLVVAQFTVSIAMICGTLIVQNQLNYIVSKNMGFNREHILIVQMRGEDDREQIDVLKTRFQATSGVQGVAVSSSLPGKSDVLIQMPIEFKYLASGDKDPNIKWLCIDDTFMKLYGIELKEGRGLNGSETDKTSGFLVNEAAAKKLKWENGTAIGKEIGYNIGEKASGWHIEKTGRVLGVVKDFHVGTLRKEIEPLLIHYYPQFMGNMSIKLGKGDPTQTLQALEAAWKQAVPNRPFEYSFLDDEFNETYKREQQLRSVVAVFAGIAIAISCLGLLGLAAYTAETRTKEIGIRKVLGASVASIIGLLSKDFLMLVMVAIILSVPVAYYISSKWLQDFAYKTELSWWIFALAGVGAVGIAFITVAGQSWRAARANPVQSLRSE